MNLQLLLQLCIDVITTASMICCTVNLLSNVEVTPVESCEFDVVVSTLGRLTSRFQRCNKVVNITSKYIVS